MNPLSFEFIPECDRDSFIERDPLSEIQTAEPPPVETNQQLTKSFFHQTSTTNKEMKSNKAMMWRSDRKGCTWEPASDKERSWQLNLRSMAFQSPSTITRTELVYVQEQSEG